MLFFSSSRYQLVILHPGGGAALLDHEMVRDIRDGVDNILGTADDVKNLANYVLSLSNSAHDSVRANLGKEKFGVCAACHGPDGKGNHALGAPNLTDSIWLHGAGEAAITAMVNNGKVNQMPAQGERLSAGQIQVLTSYVWGLSNKK